MRGAAHILPNHGSMHIIALGHWAFSPVSDWGSFADMFGD